MQRHTCIRPFCISSFEVSRTAPIRPTNSPIAGAMGQKRRMAHSHSEYDGDTLLRLADAVREQIALCRAAMRESLSDEASDFVTDAQINAEDLLSAIEKRCRTVGVKRLSLTAHRAAPFDVSGGEGHALNEVDQGEGRLCDRIAEAAGDLANHQVTRLFLQKVLRQRTSWPVTEH